MSIAIDQLCERLSNLGDVFLFEGSTCLFEGNTEYADRDKPMKITKPAMLNNILFVIFSSRIALKKLKGRIMAKNTRELIIFPKLEKLLPINFKFGIFMNEIICKRDAITAEMINTFSTQFLSFCIS